MGRGRNSKRGRAVARRGGHEPLDGVKSVIESRIEEIDSEEHHLRTALDLMSGRPRTDAESALKRAGVAGEAAESTEAAAVTDPEAAIRDFNLNRHKWVSAKWQGRISRVDLSSRKTLSEQHDAKARAVKPLAKDPVEQQALIRAAQDASRALENPEALTLEQRRMAQQINDQSREAFILCHSGFIENLIRKKLHLLHGEDMSHAREVLLQEARRGANEGIDKYKFDTGANPLTYTKNWIFARLNDVAEREGGDAGVRLKSKAHRIGQKVQAEANKIKDEGREATAEEIAGRIGATPERVAELLPFVTAEAMRLDEPAKTDEGEGSLKGELLSDPSQRVAEEIEDDDFADRVRQAVSQIESPFHRRVLEMFHGLDDDETIEQKDLFDGVYIDSEGNAFSAEPAVLADRKRRSEAVERKPQRELNELFERGELAFEPGTSEAHELARVRLADFDPDAKYEKLITAETGVPPTSGTIQDAKRIAEEKLRQSPALRGLEPRYRGDNELENSQTAREQVADALASKGVVEPDRVYEIVDPPRSKGKSSLRLLAEENDLVDKTSGRLKLANISQYLSPEQLEDTEELAEVMAS